MHTRDHDEMKLTYEYNVDCLFVCLDCLRVVMQLGVRVQNSRDTFSSDGRDKLAGRSVVQIEQKMAFQLHG